VKYPTSKLLSVNKKNEKVLAYVSFFIFEKTGEEKYWNAWVDFNKSKKKNELLKLQREFLRILEDNDYLPKYRIAVNNNMQVIGNEISLVVASIRQIEEVDVDQVDC